MMSYNVLLTHYQMSAPIFLTELGTPFSYEAWYYHWRRAIERMRD